jgi:hypothetical protein
MQAKQIPICVAILLAIASSGACAEWPPADNTRALALLDSLQVGVIDLELATEPQIAQKQLWDLYANQELGQRYAQIEVPGGSSVWPVFRARLIATAKASHLDAASLERTLDIIERQEPHLTSKGQLFPYGAFLAGRAGEAVWVIPCRWESGYRPPTSSVSFPLKAGHIRIWAFLAKSGKQIGYSTCK